VNLRELARAQPGTPEEEMLRKVVGTLGNDSALAFWNGADEPLLARRSPSDLAYAYCLTTGRGDESWCDKTVPLDPDHVWVTIQAPRGTPAELAPYSLVTDGHGVNAYPVSIKARTPDLHAVGRWTSTIASVTANRAVWTTLQICSSGSFDGTGRYVLPSYAQERYMVYDAILNGARALSFFGGQVAGCFTPLDAAHGWNWTFWNDVLEGLIQEISANSPIAPALVNPESTKALTASDSTTQVIRREGENESDLWVIAARHGSGSEAVTITGLPATVTSGAVYTEERSVSVAGGAFTDTFDRWADAVVLWWVATGELRMDVSALPDPAGLAPAVRRALRVGHRRGTDAG
jgi:hypothetical protein